MINGFKRVKVKGFEGSFTGHRNHLIDAPFRATSDKAIWGNIKLVEDGGDIVTIAYPADVFEVDEDKAREAGLEIV